MAVWPSGLGTRLQSVVHGFDSRLRLLMARSSGGQSSRLLSGVPRVRVPPGQLVDDAHAVDLRVRRQREERDVTSAEKIVFTMRHRVILDAA
jgi:hypothetical protein